jgi:hemerythrin-like metal-binding protein
MTHVQWQDALSLGNDTMDRTHHEFVEMVATLEGAEDAALLAAMDALIEHTDAHFSREDRWMEASRFPMRACHLAEHEGVLAVLREARGHVAEGRLRVARVLPPELMHWFEGHVASMDAMLARWLEAHPQAHAEAQPA